MFTHGVLTGRSGVTGVLAASVLGVLLAAPASAGSFLKQVAGQFTYKTNMATSCPTGSVLCAASAFSGGLSGTGEFTIFSLSPATQNQKTTMVDFFNGQLSITTSTGTLTCDLDGALDSSSASSTPPPASTDGEFGEICPITSGTGEFAGATGELRAFGTSNTATAFPPTNGVGEYKGNIYEQNPPASSGPDCSMASATSATVWPPNGSFAGVNVVGVKDACTQPATITITGIFQDEPVTNLTAGDNTCPDGAGIGTSTAQVRSERDGTSDGRVYHIDFTATDCNHLSCSSQVQVCVPHDQGNGSTCNDHGALFDSTKCQ